MTLEHRLANALNSADHIEPSADLWSRVLHSIDEDRAHRRRVVRSVLATLATVAALIVALLTSIDDGPTGRHVGWQTMELLETVALAMLVLVLGPAIRRFGRGYAADLWPTDPDCARHLLRLLDVGYYLVFAGYALMSAEFGESGPLLAEQLHEAVARIGGLVLIMGVLHMMTIALLPLVALVSNATRTGRALPRWIIGLLILIGLDLLSAGLLVVPGIMGMVLQGAS